MSGQRGEEDIRQLLAKAEELCKTIKSKSETRYTKSYEKKKIHKKNRFRIEQVIGIVKNWFGDRDRVKDFHLQGLPFMFYFTLIL